MRSVWEFLLVALVVALTPGPATALVLRIAARDGRRAALGAVVGNEIGVLTWAVAVGGRRLVADRSPRSSPTTCCASAARRC